MQLLTDIVYIFAGVLIGIKLSEFHFMGVFRVLILAIFTIIAINNNNIMINW